MCDFFQDVFEAPHYIVGQSQHFVMLTVSNLLGLLGVLMCCVFGVGCLTRLKFFESLRAGVRTRCFAPRPTKRARCGSGCSLF